MNRVFALLALLVSGFAYAAPPGLIVDCDQGQSLNAALSRMSKIVPMTVAVKGTCKEYVFVDGFNGLSITGLPGANVQQPTADLSSPFFVLSITNSRDVTITGLRFTSRSTASASVGIGKGSSDILLKNFIFDGGTGVEVYENSQAGISNATVNLASSYAAIYVFDKSDVHITDTLLRSADTNNWHAGLFVSAGHVTMQGVTIRDFQQGITVNSSGSIDLANFDPASATDVVVENPNGPGFNSVLVSDSSSLNVGSVVLRINNAGQPWGGETGAIQVTNGSTLNAESYNGGFIVINGSQGQGILVSNNSHAQIANSTITNGLHGGLVVVNLSTATVTNIFGPTAIAGNGSGDLFCDSKSEIFGSANMSGVGNIQCGNVFPSSEENLP